jgi:putative endonuclease
MKAYYVYILANKKKGTLYIGVTNDLIARIHAHRNNLIDGFTKKYLIHKLVYYEEYDEIYEAIIREKRMKKWKRQWKIELIEKHNPNWNDLYHNIIE